MDSQMPLSNYSVQKWLEQRSLIEHLYLERNFSIDQVRDHLCGIGFHVNTRMVRTRLLKWDLHKNLRVAELRTALKMLGPDRSQWPSQAPRFRIHGRVVDLDGILRSCGRRGIQDPFEWIRTTSDKDYEHSSNVELLTDFTTTNSKRDSDNAGESFAHSAPTTPQSWAPTSVASLVPKKGREIVRHRSPEIQSTVDWPLNDPDIYIHAATALHQLKSYCLNYMTSAHSLIHNEPKVHHLTCHARFFDRIAEGISLFSQGETKLAFLKFDNGFVLLKDMFADLHPMAIATYLLVLCQLSINKVTAVSAQLLRYSDELAGIKEVVPQHLVELLRAISKSGEFVQVPLLCLRAASDILEANATMDWKTLYVKERLCDALYHAQAYGEAAIRRAQLLKLQEARYGPYARNVLWTSMNVADDHLMHGQLHEAEARFAQVLQQSDQHSGYHRAKCRVVALEGLAKVAFYTASKQLTARLDSIPALQGPDSASQLLLRALKLADEAVELAQVWFESPSRRIKRLLDLRDGVRATLDSLSGFGVVATDR